MVWYPPKNSGQKKKPQKKVSEKELLNQAIENMKKFLKNASGDIQMDFDNIKTRKEKYVRKKDGKETKLLIAEIPVKINGRKEIRSYVYNRGFFQRRA